MLEELGAHLYHDIKVANIQGRLLPEPDLYIARLLWADLRFLRAFDRFANNSRQQLAQATKNFLVHALTVGDIDQRHSTTVPELACSAGRSQEVSRHDREEFPEDAGRVFKISAPSGASRRQRPPPGSTRREHSRGPHMSHQKRDNLLQGRVRDTRAGALERQPECRIPVSLALHHEDLRVRAGDKVHEREDWIRDGAQSLHFARELFQIYESELNSVVSANLSSQINHVEVLVDCYMENCGRHLSGRGHDGGDVVSGNVRGHEAELNVSVRGHSVLDHERKQARNDVGGMPVSRGGSRDESRPLYSGVDALFTSLEYKLL